MIRKAVGMNDDAFEDEDDAEGELEGEGEDHPFYTPAQTVVSSPVSSSRKKQPRRERYN